MNCRHLFFGFALLVLAACSNTNRHASLPTNKIKVAVFNGNGASAICVIETYEALKIDTGISPALISAAEIANDKLNDFNVVIFPGGSGSKELNNLGNRAAAKVVDFVNNGNGAVGICAGGFLFSTTKDYPSLRLVSATEWDRSHYDKGRALVEFELTAEGEKLFPELTDKDVFLQYYDGPVFMPADSGRSGIKQYMEYATYRSDIHIHPSYPDRITPGKTFLLGEDIGGGRAIVVAGHPEATPGMRWMVPRMVRWASKSKAISYQKKWVRPDLNHNEIFYTSNLVRREKELFWQLLSDNTELKLAAMMELYDMRSRPAVRWNMGLLRDNDPLVRAQAASLLRETEYSSALPDLKVALHNETDSDTRAIISNSIDLLSEF